MGLDYLSLDRSSAIFDEGELDPSRTAAKLATVQTEGAQSVTREIEFSRLEVILAVGYRGDRGGYLVAAGTPEQLARHKKSYTGQALAKLLP